MHRDITVIDWEIGRATIPAIVRGGLALHVAVRKDGLRLNEWSVSHVPTGRQVLVLGGACAGRTAFRELQRLSFGKIDNKLMRRCNTIVKKLRKRGLKVLHPKTEFGCIVRPDLLAVGPLVEAGR